jgi:peptidyl-prolyl cis-trans isomerase SurA
MLDMLDLFTPCRRLLLAATLCLAATAAAAQNVVVMVNGEPITAIDVEQRSKFIQLSTHKAPTRQEVIEELIDEKLKVREGRRFGIDISDTDVDSSYASMGGRMRMTGDQLTKALAQSGVTPTTLKARIRADLVWQQLVRGRYQSSLQVGEKEILNALEGKTTEEDATVYDYTMRPILLLVPPGSADAALEARRKDAEGLRTRFKSCDEGIPIARSLRDVAVREQIIRNSADIPPELRKVLDSVPIGQLTAPEVTRLGVEMFAVCGKAESKADSAAKRQARDTVFAKRFEERSKQYLAELRRAALIERR